MLEWVLGRPLLPLPWLPPDVTWFVLGREYVLRSPVRERLAVEGGRSVVPLEIGPVVVVEMIVCPFVPLAAITAAARIASSVSKGSYA